jgi:hypothetical protein
LEPADVVCNLGFTGAAKLPAEAQKTINQIVDAFTPTVNKFAQTIRTMLPAPSPPPPPPVISAAIDRVGQVNPGFKRKHLKVQVQVICGPS